MDILKSNQMKDPQLEEAIKIIETLLGYGRIRSIEGVVYPEGGHKEVLDRADLWLWNNRPQNKEYPDTINIAWGVADFEDRASSREAGKRHLKYDRSKFPYALDRMAHYHDCNDGITWDTVDYYLDEYCKL